MERVGAIINPGQSRKRKKKKPKPKAPALIHADWQDAVHTVSKFYNKDWDEVTEWNIMYFMERSEYIKRKQREERMNKPPKRNYRKK